MLFAEYVGFTQLAATIPPTEIVSLLNQLFTAFDQLAEAHSLEKIKTIGDAYMVVGGVPLPRPDHAEANAAMALDMQQAIQNTILETGQPLNIRIQLRTSSSWGDRHQKIHLRPVGRSGEHRQPDGISRHGCIQVAESTYTLLRDRYHFEPRGTNGVSRRVSIEVKGKGMMRTYLLTGRKP